ncbi:MAG: hypothetical protein Q7V57_00975 [Actinomycetota bacterium]|nr:hypothetical protein [Actinomycetota bacterium]
MVDETPLVRQQAPLRWRVWYRARPLAILAALIVALIVVGRSLHSQVDIWHEWRTTLDIYFKGETSRTRDLAGFKSDLRSDTIIGSLVALVVWLLTLLPKPPEHVDIKLTRMSFGAAWAPLAAMFSLVAANLLVVQGVELDDKQGIILQSQLCSGAVSAFAIVLAASVLASILLLLWRWSSVGAIRPYGGRAQRWYRGLQIPRLSNRVPPRSIASELPVELPADELHSAVDRLISAPGRASTQTRDDKPNKDDWAMCCSGGGIRSAGFALGVIRQLATPTSSNEIWMNKVKAISAVSGGNYAASGWCLARMVDKSASGDNAALKAADSVIGGLMSEPLGIADAGAGVTDPSHPIQPGQALGHHRFLANGSGGLSRTVLYATGAVSANLVQVLTLLIIAAWPIGRVLSTTWVHPQLGLAYDDPSRLAITWHHWAPALVLLGMAALCVIAEFLPYVQRVGRVLVSVLATLSALTIWTLVVGPWILVQVANLGSDQKFFTVGGVSVVAVLGSLARIAANPLRKNASRLGGVALALLTAVVFSKILHDSSLREGFFSSVWWVWSALVAYALFAFIVDTQAWSIREVYRARLTSSFVVDPKQRPRFRKRGSVKGQTSIGVTWAELAGYKSDPKLPELIVCCAASRVGLAPTGAPAESFTISQKRVSHHRATGSVTVNTADYVQSLNSLALQRLKSPAAWMATSGAAFASAMGRSSMSSTNALLAAVNADLGVWLPALEQVKARNCNFPPVRLGHLFNEVFGVYAPNDDYVFVSDGGHVENLGLVELLRAGYRNIICVDASGDTPGSFTTLVEALDMADAVLEERLYFDLAELESSVMPPWKSVYTVPAYMWGDDFNPQDLENAKVHTTIYYVKLQRSLDQDRDLRLFGRIDPRFPHYSTANQLLTDAQFFHILRAGANAARGLQARLEQAH